MITKELKSAIADFLSGRIDRQNFGMLSNYRVSAYSNRLLELNRISITSRLCATDEVLQNGEVIAKIKYRYAARKRDGMYKMLKPQVVYF